MKNNYIICKEHSKNKFIKLGFNLFCELEDMVLHDQIAFDFETDGLYPRKNDEFCCQIGNGVDSNYIIVLYENNYEFNDVIPYIQGKTLIGHNILFDLGFMYKHSFYPEKVYDTMLASKILYNGQTDEHFAPIRHDFGSVMKRELGIVYDKTDQKNIHIVKLSQPSTIEYSFNDVDRLKELHDALLLKINNNGFKQTYELHCRYIRALAYMEQCGMPISSEKWLAKMKQDEINAFKSKEKIEEYIHDNLPQFADKQLDMFDVKKRILVSITSSLQMIKVFKALGIPTKDKDGKDSINESIISKSKHEFVKLWLDFQEANHRISTFGNTIYQQIENERIYTNFNPMVDTARLSTRKGNINFLNFPSDKETRSCFKANKGNVIVVCDYSAQEGVLLADKSKDKAMTASVLEGADLHSLLTKKIHPELSHLSDEEVAKLHKDKRTQAKISRFALSFGGSAFTLHINQNIPMNEAVKIENSFKELHEGMYIWGEDNFNKAIKVGYIESADGWKLALPKYDKYLEYKEKIETITKEQWTIYKQGKLDYKKKFDENEKGKKYEYKFPRAVKYYNSKKSEVTQFFKLKSEYQRLALNNPIQSSAAHMTKLATLLIFEWILKNNYENIIKIVNVVHDECIVECPKELEKITVENVQSCMIIAGNHYLEDLEIKAEAHANSDWYSAK